MTHVMRGALSLVLLGLAFAAISPGSEGVARTAVCGDLERQYVVLFGQSTTSRARLVRQLQQAQTDAQIRGCARLFLFGGPRSAACPAIMATIGRLRQQLTPMPLFGGRVNSDFERARFRDTLLGNGCTIPSLAGGSGRTLCIRACDGYYFPISNRVTGSRLKIDAAVCQSMYAEDGQAELYVQPAGADVDRAASLTGKLYRDHPRAFAYREVYDQTCQAQLRTGISALAARYLALPANAGVELVSLSEPAPGPTSAPSAISIGAGGHHLGVEGEAGVSGGSIAPICQNRSSRLVGDSYYRELYALAEDAPPAPLCRVSSAGQ